MLTFLAVCLLAYVVVKWVMKQATDQPDPQASQLIGPNDNDGVRSNIFAKWHPRFPPQ